MSGIQIKFNLKIENTSYSVFLLGYQGFNIDTSITIESQRLQHGHIVTPKQVHRLTGTREMLVLVPRGDAESIPLLPDEFLTVDD